MNDFPTTVAELVHEAAHSGWLGVGAVVLNGVLLIAHAWLSFRRRSRSPRRTGLVARTIRDAGREVDR